MLRLFLAVLVSVGIGSACGWGTYLWRNDQVVERFERKPLSFPGKSNELKGDYYNKPIKSQDAKTPEELADEAAKLAASKPREGAVAAVVDGATHHFGTMRRRSKRQHTFVIRNVGTADLDLAVEKTTCKCTIGTLEKTSLKPGDQTGITLEWTAESLQKEFGQSAEIRTNDPLQPLIKLNIKGFVVDSLVFDPLQLDLGDFSTTEPQTRTVRLYSYVGVPLDVRSLTWGENTTADKVKLEWKPVEIDKEKNPNFADAMHAVEVTMTIAPGFRQGKLNGIIRLSTGMPDGVGNAELPIYGNGVGDVSIVGGKTFNADKSTLNIGRVKQGEGKSIKLFIAIKGPNRDKIVPSVDKVVPEDALNVSIGEPTDKGTMKLYPLILEVPKGGPLTNLPGTAGDNFGRIILKTQSEFAQEVPVYFRLVVEKDEE